MILTAVAFVVLTIWAYLLLGRGWFWRCAERDDGVDCSSAEARLQGAPGTWPSVVAIVPACDEAAVIGDSLASLLRQDYPGPFSVVIVDDQSSDATASTARATARALGAGDRIDVVAGTRLPAGWTGKIWAMRQGLAAVEASAKAPQFVLFGDADIVYAPRVLRRLVAIAICKGSVLTSLMVKLRCDSVAERWLVPAFVFFFQKLYPFAFVNDPKRSTAAAAGGCMLVKRASLASAGGLEALQGALIDDCALGALMKRQGPIWLGLTEGARSLRAYPSFAAIRRMVTRSAFAELRYSSIRLMGTVVAMLLVYVAPPLLTVFADGPAQGAGMLSWMLMTLSFVPTLRLYEANPALAPALPLVAAVYTAFTLDSAFQYWRGRGGYWKGRVQAPREA
jgi:hopene-associated glycosyltransferase HpnB